MWLLGRASPGARLLAAIWITAALSTTPLGSLHASLASACVVALVLLTLRPRLRLLVSLAFPAVGFASIVCLPIVLTDPSRGGWLFARAALVALAAAVFATRLQGTELSIAMRTLRFPSAISAVVSTMVRQAMSLRREGRKLVLARELRGARGFRTAPDLLARLLVRAAQRAERVELAMKLRGYTAEALPRAPLRASDVPPLVLALLLGLAPHCAENLRP